MSKMRNALMRATTYYHTIGNRGAIGWRPPSWSPGRELPAASPTIGTTNTNANNSSSTITTTYTELAGSYKLAVVFMWSTRVPTPVTHTGVTIGGVPAIQAAAFTGVYWMGSIWYMGYASLGSGNKPVIGTFSAAPNDAAIICTAYINAGQTPTGWAWTQRLAAFAFISQARINTNSLVQGSIAIYGNTTITSISDNNITDFAIPINNYRIGAQYEDPAASTYIQWNYSAPLWHAASLLEIEPTA